MSKLSLSLYIFFLHICVTLKIEKTGEKKRTITEAIQTEHPEYTPMVSEWALFSSPVNCRESYLACLASGLPEENFDIP